MSLSIPLFAAVLCIFRHLLSAILCFRKLYQLQCELLNGPKETGKASHSNSISNLCHTSGLGKLYKQELLMQ